MQNRIETTTDKAAVREHFLHPNLKAWWGRLRLDASAKELIVTKLYKKSYVNGIGAYIEVKRAPSSVNFDKSYEHILMH